MKTVTSILALWTASNACLAANDSATAQSAAFKAKEVHLIIGYGVGGA